ncbi:hypothetical protein MHU86_5154 [Fragilaria crotonensis]|nr:hypothetical protein MHU86_13259 [Fragilaria crotonensis]KAI2506664.1 hypothetical protein MHU86_7765 [Fragilaria crotonensis]KAI2509266.1 hypothetical protein MHU86_5154 [Fragilaria crotonensis]
MVHQAIHIPDIAPNDVILVNNIPRFLTENGNDLTHSLLVIPTADDTSAPYVSPLSVRGVTLTFRTRQSPIEAYGTLPHVTLTGEDLPWDPYDNVFTDEEAALTKYLLETGDRIGAPPPSRRLLCSVSNM